MAEQRSWLRGGISGTMSCFPVFPWLFEKATEAPSKPPIGRMNHRRWPIHRIEYLVLKRAFWGVGRLRLRCGGAKHCLARGKESRSLTHVHWLLSMRTCTVLTKRPQRRAHISSAASPGEDRFCVCYAFLNFPSLL